MAERIIPQRFLDAAEEPDQTLTPVKGYEKAPLVSLKQAVEPIKSLLYDIDAMVATALRNSKKPADGLTQDESASIHLYTMQWPEPHLSLFTLLNKNLRSKNRNVLKLWFLFLKLFFTALFKLPSTKGVIYRGVQGNLLNEYNDEDHFWWGMSSCTESINIIEGFLGTNEDRTIFNIECLNGKSIRSHSYFQDENEILLLPGSYFRIVGKLKAAKRVTIIHLREKIPEYATLASPFDNSMPTIEHLTISSSNATALKSSKAKFQQHGKIVAGGNGEGTECNQLSRPIGIIIDENKTIFIADMKNHRIIRWKCKENKGQTIAGGNGTGNRMNQFNGPADVVVDQRNNSLIIADNGNRRVTRWFDNQNQEVLIDSIDCSRLTMDQYGFLYVSDYVKNEVRRWKIGEKGKGTLVAGGNGKGNQHNQLYNPTHIFVDENQSVYISDWGNNRVMKWLKDAKEGVVAAGGNSEISELHQRFKPQGLFVDQWKQIYVADFANHRIMRWCEGDREGEIVVGGNGEGNQTNQLNTPMEISFDMEGNLYVCDQHNNRVLRFDLIL